MREPRRRRPAVRRLAIAAMALSIAWAPALPPPRPRSHRLIWRPPRPNPPWRSPHPVPVVAGRRPGRRARSAGADRPGPDRGPLAGVAACDAVPGRYLVRFAAETPQRGRAAAAARAHGRSVRSLAIVPGLELVASSLPPAEAMAALRTQPDVESVEPDCIVKLDQAPNDPGFGQQWALANTGQTGGSAGADIDALGAWSVRADASGVTVGIIDTGMQLNHPDLSANVWTNTDEVAGNGLDDDSNGYVDDVHGWDFVNNDALPADDNGHGTHVAGTIGARGNNGIGVTGVAWTVRLMPLKAFDANGSGSISAIIAALGYAVENGARVSNHSYGSGDFVRAEYDAFVAATAAGHIAFAAAGNDGVNSDEAPHYPAAFRIANVVSVAATTDTDEIAGFSNFGIRTVQVAAPGTSILSTLPGSGYGYLDGTSMATPHVTGVAALVAARNPTWTGSQIRDRILGTTRSVAGLDGKAWTGGVVDAGAALSNVATVLPPPFPSATPVALATTIDAAQVPAPVAAPTPPTFPTPTPVETSIADVGPPKIAIDAAGQPMIAYTRRMQGVQLLSRSGTGWTDRKLTSAYDDFYWLDLAVNGSGVPTVAVQRAWSNLAAWSDPGIVLVGADAPTPTQQRITAACPDADTCFWDWNPAVAYDAAGKAHRRVHPDRALGSGHGDRARRERPGHLGHGRLLRHERIRCLGGPTAHRRRCRRPGGDRGRDGRDRPHRAVPQGRLEQRARPPDERDRLMDVAAHHRSRRGPVLRHRRRRQRRCPHRLRPARSRSVLPEPARGRDLEPRDQDLRRERVLARSRHGFDRSGPRRVRPGRRDEHGGGRRLCHEPERVVGPLNRRRWSGA